MDPHCNLQHGRDGGPAEMPIERHRAAARREPSNPSDASAALPSTTMSMKPDARDAAWMAVGAAFLLLLAVIVFRYYQPPNPSKQLAFKATRLDLVDTMRTNLAS